MTSSTPDRRVPQAKAELRKLAWREAAAWLSRDADAFDLPEDLTDADEDYVREYIRNQIVDHCQARGQR